MTASDELKEEKFNAMLKPALYEQMLKEMEELEEPAERHEFSRSFDRRMKRMVRKVGTSAGSRYRSVRVAVAAGVAVVVAVGVVTMNVEALRMPIWNLFMGEEYSTLDFGGKKGEIEIPEEYVEYVPGYVLPGYELVYAYRDADKCYLQYRNLDGMDYFVSIYIENGRAAFDTEHGDMSKIEIENQDVFVMKEEGRLWVAFIKGNVLYVIEGKLEMQDIEEIVKEMK